MFLSRCIGLAFLAGLPLSASTTPLEVRVALEGRPNEQLDAHLRGFREDSMTGAESFDRKKIQVPGRFSVRVPTGSSSRLEIESEGLWAAPLLVVGAGQRQQLSWSIWRTGTLDGKLEMEGDPLPGKVDLTLWPTQRGSSFPKEIRFQCPVEASGRWMCSVPEGEFHWRVGSRGFLSHFGWHQEVTASSSVTLPAMRFERGASVVGWIQAQSEVRIDEECMVLLDSVLREGAEPAGEESPVARHHLIFVDGEKRRGFFQIPTSAGRYRLAAESPGRASSQDVELTVHPGLEARLIEPLALSRLADFELEVSPPTGPDGMPWQVFLSSPRGATKDGLASWKGHWHRHGIPEGRYGLVVKSYTHDVWWSESLDVKTGAPHLQVHLERLTLNGRLFVGHEPAAATLWFGGRQGAKSLRFESDGAGVFEGALPHTGKWRVDVELRDSGQELTVYGAEVTSPHVGAAEIELRLGESRIAGEVQDADGLPVTGAAVEATHQREGASSTVTRTDEDGRFEIVGLAPGEISLYARVRDQSSQSRTLKLEKQEPLLGIVLVLEERQEISGQINSAGVPVFGADVLAVPNELAGHWVLRGMGDRTGLAGEFSIELPDQVQSFDLAIFPPGHTATFRPFMADPSQPILVEVESLSGDLEIVFRDAPRAKPFGVTVWTPRGAQIPLSILRRWARSQGGEWSHSKVRLPNLEPGIYRICEASPSSDSGMCAEGTVNIGGALELSLPAIDVEESGLDGFGSIRR